MVMVNGKALFCFVTHWNTLIFAAIYIAPSVNALNQKIVEILKLRPLINTTKAKQEPQCQGYLR